MLPGSVQGEERTAGMNSSTLGGGQPMGDATNNISHSLPHISSPDFWDTASICILPGFRAVPTKVNKPKWNCDSIRLKCQKFLGQKTMTQTAWLKQIGVTPNSFNSFMKQKGEWKGEGSNTFHAATTFFKQYEKEEKAKAKAKSKEVKATEANNKKEKKAQGEELIKKIFDTQLPTVNGTVPVYDDCNDVRKKITEWYAVGILRNTFFASIMFLDAIDALSICVDTKLWRCPT